MPTGLKVQRLSGATYHSACCRPILAWICSLLVLLLAACSSSRHVTEKKKDEAPKRPIPYQLTFPLGLDAEAALVPRDNPLTEEKLKLGKRLYFETRLSTDGTISCASCHNPEKAFIDPSSFSSGVGGKKGTRQAPTVINRVFGTRQFWDGRAASLEEQALGPIQNPVEMAMPSMDVVMDKMKADSKYAEAFKAAFPPDRDYYAGSYRKSRRQLRAYGDDGQQSLRPL
jgi:cytochrome c peroxidase